MSCLKNTHSPHLLDHRNTFFRCCGGSERALVDFYQTRRGRNIQVACGVVCNGVVVSVFESILVGERLPALKGLCIIYAAAGDAYYAPISHWAWRVIAEHDEAPCCACLRAAIAKLQA